MIEAEAMSLRGESFRRLAPDRKEEILLNILVAKGEERRRRVQQYLSKGGAEAEFVQHVSSKPAPREHDSPENKSFGAVQTK